MSLEQKIQTEIDGQIEWLRNDALRKMRSSLEEVNREVEELPAVKLSKTDNKYLPAMVPSPFKCCDFYCECHSAVEREPGRRTT